jgi:hypothetical protein
LCFIVAEPTLTRMTVSILLGACALAVGLVAELIRRGFDNGDRVSDPTVKAQSRPLSPGARGAWVEVVIANPSPAIALVGLRLRGLRRPNWLPSPAHDRRRGPRRPQMRISDQTVGAIAAGDTERFWLWADGNRRLRLEAAVGTRDRLRIHHLPVAVAVSSALPSVATPSRIGDGVGGGALELGISKPAATRGEREGRR